MEYMKQLLTYKEFGYRVCRSVRTVSHWVTMTRRGCNNMVLLPSEIVCVANNRYLILESAVLRLEKSRKLNITARQQIHNNKSADRFLEKRFDL